MGYDFDWVVAFSDRPFGGNGCVVVHDCQELSLETRLNIVRETSLVECTFVEPSDVADFRFRIYLASREIPFAGHPTLAGVASLRHRGLVSGSAITIETQAGIIPIELGDDGQIAMTQVAPVFGPEVPKDLVAAAVSLNADDIIAEPQVTSTGLPFTITVVRDKETLERARVNPAALQVLQASIDFPDTDVMEPFLVTLQGATDLGDTYSRLLLAPPMPPEDPFTGSATGAMASYLWEKGLIAQPDFVAEQGHGMGRPGQAQVSVKGAPGAIKGVRLSGMSHVTMSGILNI
ncbi:MAG: PhzF family phenazine biosynthesis protein [Planktomarina sp.]